jgi:hypothetical protein
LAIRREDVLKMVELVPDEKLSELVKMINLLTIPEEEPTEDEIKIIDVARKEYESGETYTYSKDELRKEFLDNV